MPSTSEATPSPAASPEPQTIVERSGAIGRIRLNRPRALNSLTLEMVRDMQAALDAFERDPGVAAVLVTGEGERGLCAGGDIRAIHDAGRTGSDLPRTFWREEYRLNARINRYSKPYVALMDGIVMGGGVGVSVYGSHRVVTERTRLAMPETGIGFFPDVGASWFLTRQPNELGTYVALTGEPLGAADALTLGLADRYVPSDRLPALIEALTNLPPDATGKAISDAILRFCETPQPGALEPKQAEIDRLFHFTSVEEILEALERVQSPFAEKVMGVLRTKSPLSLAVTMRLLRLGRESRTLEACLQREFAATTAVLRSPDFYEGVRAAIIDKDRNPQWQPATLEKVTDAALAPFFEPSTETLFADTAKGGLNT
ncbi:enoyl-CoA hydratase/isomerase family protein [Sinorhizobium sp. BG8]|uniref:enoyl-CoA hydratase/isomerase family protein n=1 Tax=Sinorhizobium sp. BG8 TaxID=2613773 RepID=UPI00193E4340|nr:enoyl-CoA hydratase/isomerase family protein [Sinorhizobium sp. BG8]QRM57511.1 enoyl-CoA hydratase/isomerase family protein [Sinorhizobium sp. BG8]